MLEGFWVHPEFTLERAKYAFNWSNTKKRQLTLIERVARVEYTAFHLYAVWWLDTSVLWATAPIMPFAIPDSFIEFRFRSYTAVDGQYLVTWVATPQHLKNSFPIGTIVFVR